MIVKQRAFLAAFAEVGIIGVAAQKAGIDRRLHAYWHANHEDYRQLFADAQEAAADLLEKEARRRAIEGYERPVYQKGELVGTEPIYSDRLLEFLMMGWRPEKFRPKNQVNTQVNVDLGGLIESSYEAKTEQETPKDLPPVESKD